MIAAVEMERAAHGVIEAGTDKSQKAKAILARAVEELEREKFTGISARKHLAELLALATGEEMTAYSMESWSEEWLRRKARDSSKATMARYRSHAEAFLAWLGPARRKKPLESVTGQDIRLWQESLTDAGRAGKTVLSYVKDIGAIFRAAIREGLVSHNPCGTAVGDIDTSDSHARKPFTHPEVAALIAAASRLPDLKGRAPAGEWCGLILVAAFTGLRLGDAARLAWESVDMKSGRIALIPSKTRKKKREVRIPIQPDLFSCLQAALVDREPDVVFVFPHLAKTPVNGATGLSDTFTTIMESAGVDRGKPSRVIKEGESKGKGRITWERGFHSLRHTFTSWLRNAGVSEEDRMALTGHTTRDSHQIYSHADEQVLRDAIEKLPSMKQAPKN